MSTERNLLAGALADSADRLSVDGPSMDDVVGRARVIRRNRRMASGIAAAASVAVIAPVWVLAMTGSGDTDSSPAPATQEPKPTPAAVEYVQDGVWHQADGEEVALPKRDYTSAVVWNDQLVATYYDGEYAYIADVISDDGRRVDRFTTTGTVVTTDDHTTLAYVNTDGQVMTQWEDKGLDLGTVDLSAPGEGIAWSAAAVIGGPDCSMPPEGDGCAVYVNSGLGEAPRAFDESGPGSVVRDQRAFRDINDDSALASVVTSFNDDSSVCTGVYDLAAARFRFKTCDHDVQDISPSGLHVAAPPSMYDGVGVTSISILDATTGDETGRYAPEGGHIAQWAWGDDGRLVFDVYDGAQWRLLSMAPDGEVEELTGPAKGPDFDSPFVLLER